jgi:hypothetical protein
VPKADHDGVVYHRRIVRRATLGFVPMSIGFRLVGGTLLGIGWTVAAMFPVVRALESDVPDTTMLGVMCLVAITPALLTGRRHALAATLAWDDRSITHFLGGRVKTAIAWKDATMRIQLGGIAPRLLQITDGDGRTISLAEGHGLAPAWLHGRRMIGKDEADELVRTAARNGASIVSGVVRDASDGPPLTRDVFRLGPLALAIGWLFAATHSASAASLSMMLVCGALLVVPFRRAARALARTRTNEWIAFEGGEVGLVRARRLDGAHVLVDLGPAHHADALVGTRRGFVSATLRERERPSCPYRAGERVLDAVHLETQADRVLRFERLRTAFVDLFAYGGLFAMSVAAVLVS